MLKIKNIALIITGMIIATVFLCITLTPMTPSEAKICASTAPQCPTLEARYAELEASYKELQTILAKEREDREQNAAIKLGKVTKGFKNNNPMNVAARGKADPWLGQTGKDKEGLAKFESYTHGIRAGYLTLKSYAERHNIDTINKLVKRYAKGNQEEYAKFLSRKLGVTPGKKINLLDHMPELLAGIIEFENGYNPFPQSYFIPYKR